jgi:hypothetical protein
MLFGLGDVVAHLAEAAPTDSLLYRQHPMVATDSHTWNANLLCEDVKTGCGNGNIATTTVQTDVLPHGDQLVGLVCDGSKR